MQLTDNNDKSKTIIRIVKSDDAILSEAAERFKKT
jgi:hypothetical protein